MPIPKSDVPSSSYFIFNEKQKQKKNELARITAPNDLHNTFFLLLIQKYLWIKSKPER